MKKFIWITTQFEGTHYYSYAPEEVAFLRNEHRHIFHLKVRIEVFSNDREIEFILFKRFINSLISSRNFNHRSCEMISDDLYNLIRKEYPNREIRIEVSEDNENGSYIEYGK